MSERIDMLAGEVHFVDHLAAVWNALPEKRRGVFALREPAAAPKLIARAASHGIDAVVGLPAEDRPVLTAASGDLKAAQKARRTRLALMEHGAGQSYGGRPMARRHPSYAGGDDRPADLFLHPGEHPAARDRARYPGARVEVVGSPFLDALPSRSPGPGPAIAVAFHFDALIAPEAQPALPYYREAIGALAKRYTVLGHGHPRVIDRLAGMYARMGIELVRDFRDVCRRADLLIADNTSAMFAFAATGRPVVVLNAPIYSRTVTHGLRFWEAASVGVQVDHQTKLAAAVELALADGSAQRDAREAALDLVYAYRTGAAMRAAEVLVDWADQQAAVAA
jgi:CDP-Glycerol:Poly(glycerophosphate) glycerophosphotransferase